MAAEEIECPVDVIEHVRKGGNIDRNVVSAYAAKIGGGFLPKYDLHFFRDARTTL